MMKTKAQLIGAIAEGRVSAADQEQVRRLIAEDTSFRELLGAWQVLQSFLDDRFADLSPADLEEAYERLAFRIGGSSRVGRRWYWLLAILPVVLTAIYVLPLRDTAVSLSNTAAPVPNPGYTKEAFDSLYRPAVHLFYVRSTWDTLYLRVQGKSAAATVTVRSLTGEAVQSFKLPASASNAEIPLLWRRLPSATYRLSLEGSDTAIILKKVPGPLFVRTPLKQSASANRDSLVKAIFGPDYRCADFAFDLKYYCTDLDKELKLSSMVHWKDQETLWVMDSDRSQDSDYTRKNGEPRFYIATRFKNGLVHFRYTILDTLPRGELVKGSTTGTFPVLAIRNNIRPMVK